MSEKKLYFLTPAFVLTEEQRRIQTAVSRYTIVEANAGAAKTTTLALCVGEALARRVPPEQILVLTFTPEACSVFKSRLLELGVPRTAVSRLPIQTFDAFAATILQSHHNNRTLRCEPPETLRKYAIQAIEKAYERHAESGWDVTFDTHPLAIEQFLKFQLNAKARMLLEAAATLEGGPRDVAELLDIPFSQYLSLIEYERLRCSLDGEARFRGELDATYDLSRSLQEEGGETLPIYRSVFVDELHNMHESAFIILIELIRRDRVWFVGAGDCDQAIRRDRGADPAFMANRFESVLDQRVCRLPLTASFRYGKLLATTLALLKRKPVTSLAKQPTRIAQISYPADDWEDGAKKTVKAVLDWATQDNMPRTQAILLRDAHQSVLIESALINAGIPYHCEGLQPFYRRTEVLFLRGLMAIAFGNVDAIPSDALARTVEAIVDLGEVDLSMMADETNGHQLYRSQQAARAAVLKHHVNNPDALKTFYAAVISAGGSLPTRRLRAAVEFLASAPESLSAIDAVQKVLELTDLRASIARHYVFRSEGLSVQRSLDAIAHYAARAHILARDFLQHLKTIELTKAYRRMKPADVKITCIPYAQGAEFAHVIMPYLQCGQFPPPDAAVEADEENLFYVAASRARSQLSLLIPDKNDALCPFVRSMDISRQRTISEAAETKAASNAKIAAENTARRPRRAGSETISDVPVDLFVLYEDLESRAAVKALGACYCGVRALWYVPPGKDLRPFVRWRLAADRL